MTLPAKAAALHDHNGEKEVNSAVFVRVGDAMPLPSQGWFSLSRGSLRHQKMPKRANSFSMGRNR